MTWRELQAELGKQELDQIVGGFGLEAGLDESYKTLDSDLYDCRALRLIVRDLENGLGKRPELLTKLRRITL